MNPDSFLLYQFKRYKILIKGNKKRELNVIKYRTQFLYLNAMYEYYVSDFFISFCC